MVWDLRRALLKKEEMETSRLLDFEFRQRVRAFRLLADALELDGAELARETVLHEDEAILDMIATRFGIDRERLSEEHQRCWAQARQELIGERGDPTPYRLG